MRRLRDLPFLRRWWIRWGVLLILFAVAIIWLVVPLFMEPILYGRLQRMIDDHLNARLELDDLSYIPPYTLILNNAALIADGPAGEQVKLLSVDRLRLTLADLPTGQGPLVISKIDIRKPALHLVRDESGLVGKRGIIREIVDDIEGKGEKAAESIQRPPKLSEKFQLRRFTMEDGAIVYEDRTNPDSIPVTWDNLDMDMHTEPQSPAMYGFELHARTEPFAEMDVFGEANIDTAVLDLERLVLRLHVKRDDQKSALPGSIQNLFRKYQVDGDLLLSTSGTLFLSDPGKSRYEARLDLDKARAYIPDWDAPIDRMAIEVNFRGQPQSINAAANESANHFAVDITEIQVGSGDSTMRISGGRFEIDSSVNSWRLSDIVGRIDAGEDRQILPPRAESALDRLRAKGRIDFTAAARGQINGRKLTADHPSSQIEILAYPRDISLHPPGFDAPIENISQGSVRVRDGIVVLENLTAAYGKDQWQLQSLRLPLESISKRIELREINGAIVFNPPSPEYPVALKKIVRSLGPSGRYVVGGHYVFDRHKDEAGKRFREFQILVSSDDASMALTDRKIPVHNIRGDAIVTDSTTHIPHVTGHALGGTIGGEIRVSNRRPFDFETTASLQGVAIDQIPEVLNSAGPLRDITGAAYINITASGSGPSEDKSAMERFRAQGQFEMVRADFSKAPVLDKLARSLGAKNGSDIGHAAAHFEIEDRKVNLRRAAISMPAMGLQGSGQVDFDGELQLAVLAAPLADWRDKARQTNVPLVSTVVGEVLGAMQSILNTATSTLLYEVRITGTAKEPVIEAVPAPAITEPFAAFLASVLRSPDDPKLIDALREDHRIVEKAADKSVR